MRSKVKVTSSNPNKMATTNWVKSCLIEWDGEHWHTLPIGQIETVAKNELLLTGELGVLYGMTIISIPEARKPWYPMAGLLRGTQSSIAMLDEVGFYVPQIYKHEVTRGGRKYAITSQRH
jgi:hypothetical protein